MARSYRAKDAVSALVDSDWRRPPTIEITRSPAQITDDAVISGMVRDDRAVRDVVVFQGKDKVFYRGGDADPVVPFSVEPTLAEDDNLFAIIARDDRGLTATRSISVWNPGSGHVAAEHRSEDSTRP